MPPRPGRADAITAFYLTLEDDVTPSLQRIEKSYIRLEKALDRLNTRIQRTSDRMMGRVAQSADQLAKKVKASSRLIEEATLTAPGSGGRKGKPIEIKFTASKSVPSRKSPLFDKSGLRALWRETPHPPDYTGIIKPFAKGGIVKEPTLGMVGEAGPEAIIPLQNLAKSLKTTGMENFDAEVERITELLDGGNVTIERLNKAHMASLRAMKHEAKMDKVDLKQKKKLLDIDKKILRIRRDMKESGQSSIRVQKELQTSLTNLSKSTESHSTSITEAGKDLMSGVSEAGGGGGGGGMLGGMLGEMGGKAMKGLGMVKGAALGGVAALGGLAVASVHTAANWDTAMTKIGMKAGMTEEKIAETSEIAREAMREFALSIEDTLSITERLAGQYKKTGAELEAWTRTNALATKVMGKVADVGVDEIGTTSRFMEQLGLDAEQTEAVWGGLMTAVQKGDIEWSAMQQTLQGSEGALQRIRREGGDVQAAINTISGAAAGMSEQFGDPEIINRFMDSLSDPAKMEEASQFMHMVARNSGMSVQEMQRAATTGEGLGDVMKGLYSSIADTPDEELNMLGSQIESITGVQKKTIEQVKAAGQAGKDSFNAIMDESIKAGSSVEALGQAYEQQGKSLEEIVNSFKAEFSAMLLEIGAPLLELVKELLTALKPILGPLMEGVKKIMQSLMPVITSITDMVVMLAGIFLDNAGPIFDVLVEIGQMLGEVVGELAKELGPFMGEFLGMVMPAIAKMLKSLVPAVSAILKAIIPLTTVVLRLLMPVLEPLLDAMVWVVDILAKAITFVANLVGKMARFANEVAKAFQSLFGEGSGDSWLDAVASVADYVLGLPSKLFEFVMDIGSQIGEFVMDLPGMLLDAVIGAFEFVWDSLYAPVFDLIRQGIEELLDWLGIGVTEGKTSGETLDSATIAYEEGQYMNAAVGVAQAGAQYAGELLSGLQFWAAGGIVTEATAGIAGEGGPEAVIPLDRLPEMVAQMGFTEDLMANLASAGLTTAAMVEDPSIDWLAEAMAVDVYEDTDEPEADERDRTEELLEGILNELKKANGRRGSEKKGSFVEDALRNWGF